MGVVYMWNLNRQMRDLSLQMSKGRWDTAGWGNGPGAGASGEYTPGEWPITRRFWPLIRRFGKARVKARRALVYCSSCTAVLEGRKGALKFCV